MGRLTNTVSGNAVSFRSAADADIKSLKCYFKPKQNGTGDPSQNNIRQINGWEDCNITYTGKNLLNPNLYTKDTVYELNGITYVHDGNGIITLSGKSNGQSSQTTFTWTQPFDCNYYYCGNVSFGVDIGDTYIWDITTNSRPTKWDGTTTIGASYLSKNLQEVRLLAGHRIQFCVRVYSTSTVEFINETAKPMLLPATCTDTTFEPYRNLNIPITFPTIGKNKFFYNVSNYTTEQLLSGQGELINRQVYHTGLYNGTYTLSASLIDESNRADGNWGIFNYGYMKDGQVNTISVFIHTTTEYTRTITVAGDEEVVIIYTADSMYGANRDIQKYNIQIELGDTATTYESYSVDNTCYGGYTDPVSGQLWKTFKSYTFNGEESLGDYSTGYTDGIRLVSDIFDDCTSTGNLTICDKIPLETTAPYTISRLGIRIGGGTGRFYFYVPDSMFDGEATVEKFKQWLSENTPTVVAKLTDPILVATFTPMELKTYLGYNNIWSNTNDNIEIEYDLYETRDIAECKKRVLLAQPHLESASNEIITFNTDMETQFKECKINFLPVQAGSGDPSPSNVRTISGWNGVNIYRTGYNLVNLSTLDKINNSSNIDTTITNNTITISAKKGSGSGVSLQQTLYWYIPPALRGQAMYFGVQSVTLNTNNANHKATIVCEFKDANNTFITDPTMVSWINNGDSNTLVRKFTIPTNAVKAEFYFRIAQNASTYSIIIGDSVTYSNFYIGYPANTYGYQAYDGTTIPIDWTSNGTVYCGYLDLINNELVRTHKLMHYDGTEDWKIQDGVANQTGYAPKRCYILKVQPASNTYTAAISDKFTPSLVWVPPVYGITINNYGNLIIGLPAEMTTDQDVKDWLQGINGFDVILKLDTPEVYQITPQTLKTIKGMNNIWSSANSTVDIKYWAH